MKYTPHNTFLSRACYLLGSLVLISLMSCSGTDGVAQTSTAQESNNKKPNFLWLISEDNSKHFLKLYDQAGASMPMVEELAEQGLIFDNAFSNAPVCSTARSTLATGAYGPRIGTLNHRTAEPIELPDGFTPFSESLKKAGYYTTNNFKSDYNFEGLERVWHQSKSGASWQERTENQPFFHVQSWKTTHEHTLHFPVSDIKNKPTRHDMSKVDLAPIYPDTEAFRYTQARYLDHHQDVDAQMNKVLDMLKQDGELENTFIFYFGDHGGVLPASKGYIFERGLNVPLIVRVPKNFRHLLAKDMQQPNNTRVDGFVSFIDFAPTLLKLAGLESEEYHDGKAFLGNNISLKALNKRDVTFSHADRFDEKSDLVRAVRKGDLKYIRNYQPFYSDGLFAEYRYRQYVYEEWKSLFQQGKLNEVQSAFFKPKAPEALYDIANDPHETTNLAALPKYQTQLVELRGMLQNEIKSWPDLGFYPESELLAQHAPQGATAIGFGQANKTQIAGLIDIADLQLVPYLLAKPQLSQLLKSADQWQRYWALITLSSFGKQAAEFNQHIKQLAKSDSSIHVQARAIEFLGLNKVIDPVKPLSDLIANTNNQFEQLQLLNIATNLHEQVNAVFVRPAVNTWPAPDKSRASYRGDRFFDVWFNVRWDYISDKI